MKKEQEVVKYPQHADMNGNLFGKKHPIAAKHKKPKTQKHHSDTMKKSEESNNDIHIELPRCADINPITFYPYPSVVLNRIVSIEYSAENSEIETFRKYLIERFNKCGIRCYDDNKIAFRCGVQGNIIYFGFYDWTFSVGYKVRN